MSEVSQQYQLLKNRSIQVRSNYRSIVNRMKSTVVSVKQDLNKLKEEKQDILVQESSIRVLREIIDRMSQDHLDKVINLLTVALQTIFYDRDFSVEKEIGDARYGNNAMKFFLIEKKVVDGKTVIIRSPFDDGIGGGVLAVAGVVLQIFYIGYYHQAHILFCDESFSQVSTKYISTLFEFLHKLSVKKDFIFVLISHDDRLIQEADKVYQVSDGHFKVMEVNKDAN